MRLQRFIRSPQGVGGNGRRGISFLEFNGDCYLIQDVLVSTPLIGCLFFCRISIFDIIIINGVYFVRNQFSSGYNNYKLLGLEVTIVLLLTEPASMIAVSC